MFIDGLPVAASGSLDDVIPVAQGGTSGIPGSAQVRQLTLQQLLALVSTVDFSGLPTSPSGLATGMLWNNIGVLCIAP